MPGGADTSARDDREHNDYIGLQMIPFHRRSASITDALDYEIAREQASALGRAGRALEAALAALEGAVARDSRPRFHRRKAPADLHLRLGAIE